MKVSKKSWHYRMIGHFPWCIRDRFYPVSLCNYFWTVVWTFVFCIGIVPIAAAMLIVSAGFAAWIVLYPILQFWISWYPEFGIFSGIVDTVLLLGFWCWYRKEFVDEDKCSEVAGLVGQYIEAKHRKICPLLDFE